ncbi:MAG TPA: DUF2793 domain-containing protein [Amaricoccus sp.]|uniref:DUF2793 domain-containing protein n=1 Tax=Amaricoccus sp. TaxID=1872485 RepID=UPI002C7408EB|nr:DUF2793 domain-containing protein [Amaricoccus sp.]HRO11647.1 DUF2793 domain-containing protein [Amaricoccus sp.]
MARTAQLGLPLVAPAQAQKHVTVNEALARLDAAAQLRVVSSVLPVPPANAVDGQSYLVPAGATGEWAGLAGRIAVRSNGGWSYLVPKIGWRAWDEGLSGPRVFDGAGWVSDAVAVAPQGSALRWRVIEFDHAVTPGPSNTTSVVIPSHAQLTGVTGRVVTAFAGPGLTGWKIGVAGAADRYGAGLGIGLNSYLVGLSGTPVTYYAATPLLLTAEGGSFSTGALRLALHVLQLEPPRPV